MRRLEFLWSKLFKKIRGSAIRSSDIDKSSKIGTGSNLINVKMGRNSFCGYDCTIINCQIGAFCSLANNISIGLASHPTEWVSTSSAFLDRKDSSKKKYAKHQCEAYRQTIIGNDVWIGAGVYIKAGVKVGDGAVIGMGSVVTKDVPDYAIVAGSPAKIIRKRFTEEQIQKLQSIMWWNWEEEKLYEYGPMFNNVELFLESVTSDN